MSGLKQRILRRRDPRTHRPGGPAHPAPAAPPESSSPGREAAAGETPPVAAARATGVHVPAGPTPAPATAAQAPAGPTPAQATAAQAPAGPTPAQATAAQAPAGPTAAAAMAAPAPAAAPATQAAAAVAAPNGTQVPDQSADAPAGTDPSGAAEARPSFRERGRLRRRLRFLRRLRELGFRDLGGLVFDQHRFDRRSDELVRGKLTALAAVDAELRALERALDDRRPITELREPGISACARCGAVIASDARFCSTCGEAVGGARPIPGVGDATVPAAPAGGPGEPPAAQPARPPMAAPVDEQQTAVIRPGEHPPA
jgi:hypothetical protein